MKKIHIALIAFLPVTAFSQTTTPTPGATPAITPRTLDLVSLCATKNLDVPVTVIDHNGFCENYLKMDAEGIAKSTLQNLNQKVNSEKCSTIDPKGKSIEVGDRWKVRFYASHSFTTYFNSNVKFKSSRYDLEVKNYEWKERSSREFFLPKTWKEPGHNPFQMIDEPTNSFVVSLEKDGHEFFLSAFHPKVTMGENKGRDVVGTVDGTDITGTRDLRYDFYAHPEYQPRPAGDPGMATNNTTHRAMFYTAGYAHRFKLLDHSKIGSITYVPSIDAGLFVGQNSTAVLKKDSFWDFDTSSTKLGIIGFGGGIGNRIEFNTPKERFGIFYQNKFSAYKVQQDFLDGKQNYVQTLMQNEIGFKFMLYNPANHKKRVPAGTP